MGCQSKALKLAQSQGMAIPEYLIGLTWHIPGDHTAGGTVVIARTEKGVQLLQEAMDAGYLSLSPLEPEQILRG